MCNTQKLAACLCVFQINESEQCRHYARGAKYVRNQAKYVTKSTYSALYPCIGHTIECIRYAGPRILAYCAPLMWPSGFVPRLSSQSNAAFCFVHGCTDTPRHRNFVRTHTYTYMATLHVYLHIHSTYIHACMHACMHEA